MKLRVLESSKNPSYSAVLVLNVNGMSDITAVEIWQKGQKRWEALRRVYGVVFDFFKLKFATMKTFHGCK